jgi:hypothetical protein
MNISGWLLLAKPDCRLPADSGELFEKRGFANVILSASGQELHTHKRVLSAKSYVFLVLFRHDIVTYSRVLFTLELYCTLKFYTQLVIALRTQRVRPICSSPRTQLTTVIQSTTLGTHVQVHPGRSRNTNSLFKPTAVRRQIHTHVLTRAISKPHCLYQKQHKDNNAVERPSV